MYISFQTYQCESCEYRGATHSALKAHMRAVHENVRKHRCEFCEFTSFASSALKRHILAIHEKRKPFECDKVSHFRNICHLRKFFSNFVFLFFSVLSKVLTKNRWSFILPTSTRTKEFLSICKSKPLIRKEGKAIGNRPPSCTRLPFNPNTSPRSSWSLTPPLKRPSPPKLLWLKPLRLPRPFLPRLFQPIKLQRKLLLPKPLLYNRLNEMGRSLFFLVR